jgi:hypothetical protein
MIKTIIAFDDNDFRLGIYFEESHGDIIDVIGTHVTNISIPGLHCTEANINTTLTALNPNQFIFIALSHGNCDEFVSNEVFISSSNANRFANSFIYSTACSTGKNLSKILISNGCLAFIGYEEEIEVLLEFSSTFFTCENFGIKSFIRNNESIEVSFQKMIDFYNSEIDRLVNGSMDELITASYLVKNKESLVILGDKTLTKSYFDI